MVKVCLIDERIELKPYVRFGLFNKSYQIIFSDIRVEYVDGTSIKRGKRIKHANKINTV